MTRIKYTPDDEFWIGKTCAITFLSSSWPFVRFCMWPMMNDFGTKQGTSEENDTVIQDANEDRVPRPANLSASQVYVAATTMSTGKGSILLRSEMGGHMLQT